MTAAETANQIASAALVVSVVAAGVALLAAAFSGWQAWTLHLERTRPRPASLVFPPPAWTDSGLVVVDALGQPEHPDRYSDHFRAIAADAGLPPIRLHSLRHSLAHWLHSLGLPPADCAALLGHRVDVFMSVYLPEAGATGANHAASVLGQAVAAAG